MAHPHLWVRLGACQFLEFILAAIDTKKVEKLLKNPDDDESGYIYSDPVNTLRSLSLDLIAQLQPEMNVEELSNQVVKNLVFIARLLKSLNPRYEKSEDNEETEKTNSLSLLWLVKRMRRSVNMEVTQSPKLICVVRKFDFYLTLLEIYFNFNFILLEFNVARNLFYSDIIFNSKFHFNSILLSLYLI